MSTSTSWCLTAYLPQHVLVFDRELEHEMVIGGVEIEHKALPHGQILAQSDALDSRVVRLVVRGGFAPDSYKQGAKIPHRHTRRGEVAALDHLQLHRNRSMDGEAGEVVPQPGCDERVFRDPQCHEDALADGVQPDEQEDVEYLQVVEVGKEDGILEWVMPSSSKRTGLHEENCYRTSHRIHIRSLTVW